MANVIIGVPLIPDRTVERRTMHRRQFSGDLPKGATVPFVAEVVRRSLEATNHPEHVRLAREADDFLVNHITFVLAVSDEVWKENGLYPLGDWVPVAPNAA